LGKSELDWEGATMEKTVTTKEKIIYESLKLFSEKGYDGVSMREIAAAVGIKGASIYNHFKGKEDIFHAIFDEMKSRYSDAAAFMNIPMEQNDKTVNVYFNIDEAKLLEMAESLLYFFCKDEFTVMFRKLLIGEQHKSIIAANMLQQYYIDAPILFQTNLFEQIQRQGKFTNFDPGIMALHFYSPIYYILSKNDLGVSFEENLEIIKKHVHYFCDLYTT
jgi:AcrR family transcriptional regulator